MLCVYTVTSFLEPNRGLPSVSISGNSRSYRFLTGPVICIM